MVILKKSNKKKLYNFGNFQRRYFPGILHHLQTQPSWGEFGWWLKARRAVYKGGFEAAGGMRLSASVGGWLRRAMPRYWLINGVMGHVQQKLG